MASAEEEVKFARRQLEAGAGVRRSIHVRLDTAWVRVKRGGMTGKRMKPADCRTMAEVRHGIDRLDEQIVALLAERFRYMEAAARIKQDRGAVRDERRKAEVIANARRIAAEEGVPVEAIEGIYERLVESSICYEFEQFDAIHDPLKQTRSSAGED